MDKDSLALVDRSIRDRIGSIRQAVPKDARGRGRKVVALVEAMLSAVEGERSRLLADAVTATPEILAVLGRQLVRLLTQVTSFSTLTPYLADVDRHDLSLGLLQTADVLVADLLADGADAVIHLDEHHMYSTLDLLVPTKPILNQLGYDLPTDGSPLVFFIPHMDPHNALLLPILAHEVGHAAVEESSLGSMTLANADLDALNTLLDECLEEANNPEAGPWQVQLFSWIDELLCDALAIVLTGPSFLFAESVFLPAPRSGSLGSHPFPADRVRFALESLVELGWGDILNERVPNLRAWLSDVVDGGSLTDDDRGSVDPRERFLREGLRTLEGSILETARNHVRRPLTPQDFDEVDSRMAELLHLAIPPAQIGGEPVPLWLIILAAWLHRFDQDGDAAETLALASDDLDFNAFILKAIEMSRVVSLWGET